MLNPPPPPQTTNPKTIQDKTSLENDKAFRVRVRVRFRVRFRFRVRVRVKVRVRGLQQDETRRDNHLTSKRQDRSIYLQISSEREKTKDKCVSIINI